MFALPPNGTLLGGAARTQRAVSWRTKLSGWKLLAPRGQLDVPRSLPGPAAAPTSNLPPKAQLPGSQSGPVNVRQLCADYDIANPAPLLLRSRTVTRLLKALAQGDPWAYDIFKQDGKAFVEGGISAPEFRDRYISIFGGSANAEVAFLEMAMAVPRLDRRCQLLRTAPVGVLQAFEARLVGAKVAATAARRARRDELLAAWEAGEIDGEEALRLGLAELDDEDEEAWGGAQEEARPGPAWNDPPTEEDIAATDPQLRSTYLVGWQALDRQRIDAYLQDLLQDPAPAQTSPGSAPTSSTAAPTTTAATGSSAALPGPAAAQGAAEAPAAGIAPGGDGVTVGSTAGSPGGTAAACWDPEGGALAGEGVHLNSLSAVPARKLPSRKPRQA